ncbi:MAG: hypothetical protein WDN28_13880 [Chthoniobacter sp.]
MPVRHPLGGSLRGGCAPQVVLAATHISALEYVALEDLQGLAAT